MQGHPTVASMAYRNKSANATPKGKYSALRKSILSKI